MTKPHVVRVGVISDTHGLVRPQALEALRGCDSLLHAGDICSRDVLDALESIAPVAAVRGNNDIDFWARDLPEDVTVEIDGVRIHVVHDIKALRVDPEVERLHVVVFGHSHLPDRKSVV